MIVKHSVEIYLDSNATTPVLPLAVKEALETMQAVYGNPSSSHSFGLRAKEILENARSLAAEVLGADDGQIIFTSGATEAIQLGIFSTLCQVRKQRASNPSANPSSEPRLLLYGATEHKAVPQALHHWNELLCIGNQVLAIPVDQYGRLDTDFIREHSARADMICTMAVNNETGVVTDLRAVESAIRDQNPDVLWLVDSVQAIGKLNLQLRDTTIDYAPVSGHKIYAPKGIGFLYASERAPIVPLMAGGGQEHGARGGTENMPGIAAIAAVLRTLARSDQKVFSDESLLQCFGQRIVRQLKQTFPSIVFNTPLDHAVPTTINFAVKGFSSKELLDLFDAAGVRVSSGSACGSANVSSYVLDAMGLPEWQSTGAIRLSFGPMTTAAEIDSACVQIEQIGLALSESGLIASPGIGKDHRTLDGLIQLKNGSMCTWLLMNRESGKCVVIDPFEELAERIETLTACLENQIVAVLDTHAHVDHESCRKVLLDHVKERAAPSAVTEDLLGWPAVSDGKATLSDGTEADYLELGDDWVIAQTDFPGHTQIGRAYLAGKLDDQKRLLAENIQFAFLGDMILIGGIGRTDFESSAPAEMYDSLKRLPKIISPETLLCPTHDYNNDFATTLATELEGNCFLRELLDASNGLTKDEFLKCKPSMDAFIDDEGNSELVCGHVLRSQDTVHNVEVGCHDLKSFLAAHPDTLVVDVREPHEFVFSPDWRKVGLQHPPLNIPLTQLIGKLPELKARLGELESDVIFLCRSGKRSSKAAEVARRLGLTQVKTVAGGIALSISSSNEPWDAIANAGFVI